MEKKYNNFCCNMFPLLKQYKARNGRQIDGYIDRHQIKRQIDNNFLDVIKRAIQWQNRFGNVFYLQYYTVLDTVFFT